MATTTTESINGTRTDGTPAGKPFTPPAGAKQDSPTVGAFAPKPNDGGNQNADAHKTVSMGSGWVNPYTNL